MPRATIAARTILRPTQARSSAVPIRSNASPPTSAASAMSSPAPASEARRTAAARTMSANRVAVMHRGRRRSVFDQPGRDGSSDWGNSPKARARPRVWSSERTALSAAGIFYAQQPSGVDFGTPRGRLETIHPGRGDGGVSADRTAGTSVTPRSFQQTGSVHGR